MKTKVVFTILSMILLFPNCEKNYYYDCAVQVREVGIYQANKY